MANNLTKSGITTSATAEAWHVTQSIDALTGAAAYNITITGSLNLTGSATTGSFGGDGSRLTGVVSSSYAVTASHALNSVGGGGGGIFAKTGSVFSTTNDLEVTGSVYVSSDITASGHISASGNIFATRYYGNQGYNNYLTFNQSSSLFKVQSETYIKFDGNSPKQVTVNEGTNDIDFVVKGASNNPLLKTDSATNKIGMHGVGTPTAGLHIADNLWVSGSNGHITASGNISASGNLTCANSHTSNDLGVKISGSSTDGDARNNQILYNRYLQIRNASAGEGIILTHDEIISGSAASTAKFGTFVASGNISSSGTIIAANFSASNAFHVDAHDDFEFTIDASNFNMKNWSPNSSMWFLTTAGSGSINFGTNNNNGEFKLNMGSVTASGNISASGANGLAGKIYANSYLSKDVTVAIFHEGSNTMRLGSNGTFTQIMGNGFKIDAPTTSSYHISSSANIYALTGSFSHVVGASPLTIQSDNFILDSSGNITGSGAIQLKKNVQSISNAAGARNITMTEALYPPNTIITIDGANGDSADVTFNLPALSAGLEYTFVVSTTLGSGSFLKISGPSSQTLQGIAICDNGTEDIAGEHFAFVDNKAIKGTKIQVTCDGTMYFITAFCLCDIGDVETS